MSARINVVDFETEGIDKRPYYPPTPVGVAITHNGRTKYYAWGHPTQNNCTKREAVRALKAVYADAKRGVPIAFHNAKFDLEVAYVHLGLPFLEQHQFEDTMVLAFLHDPRDKTFSLKPLGVQYLGMDPDEQDAVKEWVLANVKEATEKTWGAYIARAPGKLVGKYAKGDVIRTKKLFEKFYPHIVDNGMQEAYIREKRIIPEVVNMEVGGVPIDTPLLKRDLHKAYKEVEKLTAFAHRKLGKINLNSGDQLADALEAKGYVTEFKPTATGKRSTSRDNLIEVCNNKRLVEVLGKLSKYNKLIGTYMEPWLASAEENDGIFHPWFNSVRGDYKGGTKTGRFSSNFQQTPKEPDDDTLPFMRDYVIADRGQMLYNRDFSQQEIRILAHFENGELMAMYIANPHLDIHAVVGEIIADISSKEYPRKHIKIVNFGVVYGSGAPSTSERVGCSLADARELLKYHAMAIPGLKTLREDIKLLARRGDPVITIGGRIYYEEPPGADGRSRAYKLLNTIIQGSASDHTKEALLRIRPVLDHYGARFLLTVHDEFLISGPKTPKVKIMCDIRDAMNFDDMFDVPMLSDGKWGQSWGSLVKCKY